MRKFFVGVIFGLLTAPAIASEGLYYASLALCMDFPNFITAHVNACSAAYPQLSARAGKALAAWKQRNEPDSPKVASYCESELRRAWANPPDFEARVQALRKV